MITEEELLLRSCENPSVRRKRSFIYHDIPGHFFEIGIIPGWHHTKSFFASLGRTSWTILLFFSPHNNEPGYGYHTNCSYLRSNVSVMIQFFISTFPSRNQKKLGRLFLSIPSESPHAFLAPVIRVMIVFFLSLWRAKGFFVVVLYRTSRFFTFDVLRSRFQGLNPNSLEGGGKG